jgi:hypothetical protein
MLPEKDDFVWVMFEGGRLDNPVWSGAWYAKDELHSDYKGKLSGVRGWTTPKGHQVTINDADKKIMVAMKHESGAESFVAITEGADGEAEMIIQTKTGETIMLGKGAISIIDATNGHTIAFDDEGIKIFDEKGDMVFLSQGGITVLAQGDLALSATGVVNIDSGMVNINGNVEPAVLGNQLMSWLAAHTHIGNLGAPTPINPADAAKVATLISQKVKVG